MTPESRYDRSDGWDNSQGCEVCPHCAVPFSVNGGYYGCVYDSGGQKYDFFYDTDAARGPFFCPDCWDELETERKASENMSLGEFA